MRRRYDSKKIPKKYQPKGFEIIHEDDDIIVGFKSAGILTVAAPYERERTVQHFLNDYVKKGNSRSRHVIYVVHRLDRETSGVLIFAKNQKAQDFLKDHWKENKKIYYAVVYGRMTQKAGTISSYLVEDDKYRMHSLSNAKDGKLAHTAYKVIKETDKFSLLEIDLLTGRKNQIRVHLSGEGHPLVGDQKYGRPDRRYPQLALHARSISFVHPKTGERVLFEAPVPEHFFKLVGYQW